MRKYYKNALINDWVINDNAYTLSLKLATVISAILIIYLFCAHQKSEKPQFDTIAATLPVIKTNAATGNIWYDKFVNYEAVHGDTYYRKPNANTLGWAESYILRSYVKMYEVTKDEKWLNKLTMHIDTIIAHAADTDGDGFLDWKTPDYSKGNYPYLVFDGLITLPIAQFVRLVHENPATLSAYKAKAAGYCTFIEKEIVPKWVSPNSFVGNCWVQVNSTTGYFKEPTNFDTLPAAVFDPLPYNMMAPYAQMLLTLYDVNRNKSYLDRANQIIQYFKDALVTNGTGYTWHYCNISKPHIEDASHANLELEMVIESFNQGGAINGAMMQGLANTLTANMWNQSATAPLVSDKVDGTGTTYAFTKLLTGWADMTQFNPAAWTIAAEQFRAGTISTFNHAYTLTKIIAWDPVKVQNQGFEYPSAADRALPACWARLEKSGSNVKRVTTNKNSGSACVSITSATVDKVWQGLYQDWKEWEPNSTYVATFNVKTKGKAGACIFIQNTITGKVLGTRHDYDSAAWSTQTFTFTTPASGSALRLVLENHELSAAGTAFFDNVVIKKSGDAF